MVSLFVLFASLLVTAPSALALPTEFGSEGEHAGQFEQPRGVAVAQSGDVYVVDQRNSRVERWTSEGVFLSAWGWGVADGATPEYQVCEATCFPGLPGSGAGQFTEGGSVAVDNSLGASGGDVYIVDNQNLRVEKFSATGEFLLMFGGEVNQTEDGEPGATQAQKNLCTAASGDVCKAGVAGSAAGEFERPGANDVAVDPTGTVYVGDAGRVQRFTPGGEVEGQIPLKGAGPVEELAVDSAKDIYVAAQGLSGVRKYDSAGKELGTPRDATGIESRSIAMGPSDELFVDSSTQRVLEYTPAGALELSLPELSLPEETENSSLGIAFSAAKDALYVLHPGFVGVLPLPHGPVVVPGKELASELQPTSATLGALVNPEGSPTEYHFEYGATTAYGESTPISGPLVAVDEVQAVAVTASGGAFTLAFNGEATPEIPFNATAAEVQAALDAVPGLGAGQSVVSGEPGGPWSVRFTGSRGGEDIPELSVESGNLTGPEPSAGVSTTTPGVSLFDDRAVSAPIKELQPGTLYHFRVVATNALNETTYGADQTFETLPPVSIENESALNVTSASAKLAVELNPHGQDAKYRFEYGHSVAYEKTAPIPDGDAGAGNVAATFKMQLERLEPDTVYHYRVSATNSFGTVHGADRTFTTESRATTGNLDGRSWEQVSPSDKHGVALEAITDEGGIIQAAEDGGGLAYVAKAPIEAEPAGNRSLAYQQQLASRAGGRWTSRDIGAPRERPAGFSVGNASEYLLFSSDLAFGFLEPPGDTPLAEEATEPTPYLRVNATSTFVPLEFPGNVAEGVKFGGLESGHGTGVFSGGGRFYGASPDGSVAILGASQPLTNQVSNTSVESLYEWHGGKLNLVSILPNQVPAAEEGIKMALGQNDVQVRRAISENGRRVIFGGGGHLYLRDTQLGETVQLDVRQPGSRGGNDEATFRIANAEATRVYFTDTSRLTTDSRARSSGHQELYLCEVVVSAADKLACALKDVSVDSNSGEARGFLGTVIGSSVDGTRVYFAANSALAPGAVRGDCESANLTSTRATASCNLYEYDAVSGVTRLVAVVSNRDEADWGAAEIPSDLGGLTGRVSPNGEWLVFMSRRPITNYDNRDAVSGERDEEVFLFNAATAQVTCVSCASSGTRPTGTFDPGGFPGLLVDRPHLWEGQWLAAAIPGGTRIRTEEALYLSRTVSDTGRVFFNSQTPLVPSDTNGQMDVYEFEPNSSGGCVLVSGCVALVSSGVASEESAFLDASVSGNDAFFMTYGRLASADTDNAYDIYDAHVCSAQTPCPSSVSVVPPACITVESCRVAPSSQPVLFGPPASSSFSGRGNVAPAGRIAPGTLSRAQKLKRALAACARKPRRRRPSCRSSARRRYGPPSARHSSNNKGAK